MYENPSGKLNVGIECNKENQELECNNRENFENMSVNENNVIDIGKVSDAISSNSDRHKDRRVSEPEHDVENLIPEDENKSSPRPRVLTTPDDPQTPDRPGRPSVPTPGKYGTQYGGAPSPGPAPCSDFLPPGFVPPTPPVSSSRRSVTRSGTLMRKCLSSSLMIEDNCLEGIESTQEIKKIRLNDQPSINH